MTTKRFITRNGVFYTDTKTGYEFQCYGEVANMMNELAEENEQLKSENEWLKSIHFANDVLKENKELKQQLKDCEKRVTDKEVEWLRNNTVWEVMPNSHRTYTSTKYHRRNDE